MSILSIRNVSYRYQADSKEVIRNISMDFEPGRLYVIVGKSESGKTTLLSLIAGFSHPTQGQILYEGSDLNQLEQDEYRAKKIGIIYQSHNLLMRATGLENLELALEISQTKTQDKREMAYRLLERVGINQEIANVKVLKLSEEQQQQIVVARALITNPGLIIADEPSRNLSSETEARIMKYLLGVAHRRSKCVIIVTNSRNIATYADEIWGINAGRLSFVR